MSKLLSNNLRTALLILLLSINSFSLADNSPKQTPAPENSALNDMGELTDGRVKEKPQIEKLGEEQYRIGLIHVDKKKRLITIPGKMLSYDDGKPIEFLATMKNGYKSYESTFMLDTNAFAFNLACILIGLDSANAVPPKFHFDPEPVKGDQVAIRVSWENKGKIFDYDVIKLFKSVETDTKERTVDIPPAVWSYTGSIFINGDQYLAQMDGVLIGLVHDPASIIEHKIGFGLGNYGFFSINKNIAPDSGQEILITIQAKN